MFTATATRQTPAGRKSAINVRCTAELACGGCVCRVVVVADHRRTPEVAEYAVTMIDCQFTGTVAFECFKRGADGFPIGDSYHLTLNDRGHATCQCRAACHGRVECRHVTMVREMVKGGHLVGPRPMTPRACEAVYGAEPDAA